MSESTLRLNEIFYSIQGESTRAGFPCIFVRLTGCHLRCAYCDTEYAFKEGQSRQIDEIIAEVEAFPCDLVQMTGGEPLLQKRVHELMERLCDLGKTVLIETSGACDISVCDPRVIRIMDLKTPSSGESKRNDWRNVEYLTARDEVKFVIGDRRDYEWAKDVIERHDLLSRCGAVLMSPVFEQPAGLEIAGMPGLPMRDLADWLLHEPPGRPGSGERTEPRPAVRLQTQLHKFIWDPQMRGV